jgi:hypothetical protein
MSNVINLRDYRVQKLKKRAAPLDFELRQDGDVLSLYEEPYLKPEAEGDISTIIDAIEFYEAQFAVPNTDIPIEG